MATTRDCSVIVRGRSCDSCKFWATDQSLLNAHLLSDHGIRTSDAGDVTRSQPNQATQPSSFLYSRDLYNENFDVEEFPVGNPDDVFANYGTPGDDEGYHWSLENWLMETFENYGSATKAGMDGNERQPSPTSVQILPLEPMSEATFGTINDTQVLDDSSVFNDFSAFNDAIDMNDCRQSPVDNVCVDSNLSNSSGSSSTSLGTLSAASISSQCTQYFHRQLRQPQAATEDDQPKGLYCVICCQHFLNK